MKKYMITTMLLMFFVLLPSCSNEVEYGQICSVSGYTTIESDHYSFFGTWHLEDIVIRPTFFWDTDDYAYVQPIDVDVYVGYVMEFGSCYVRLGERIMTYPAYDSSGFSRLFLSISDYREMLQEVFGYFDSPYDLMEKGLDVVYEGDYFLRFYSIDISYPQYPELWFRGYHKFDPLLIDYGLYEFHPLFRQITVLSEDFIIIGWRERFLARRITNSF